MRLIDENAYQEKLAKIPMDERTFRKAVEVALDMPTVCDIEQIRADIEAARYGLINDGLDVALSIIDKHTEGR